MSIEDPRSVVLVKSTGPGTRFTRTAGQGGGTLVLVELWQAFGWFGADHWTAAQSSERWPSVTAAVLLIVSAVHNTWNYLQTRKHPA